LPVSHSSEISTRTAVTRRKSEDSPGNNPTTRVLRLICELSVSHLLEVRSRFLAASGKLKTMNPSGRLASPQAANCGALLAYSATKAANFSSAWARSSALKMRRMSSATFSSRSLVGM